MMIDERSCRYCDRYECPLKKDIPYMDLLKHADRKEDYRMSENDEKTRETDDPEKPLDQFKRLFSYYLKQNHTGEENAIFSRELEELFHMGGRDIRRVVSSLRKDGIPICSGSHKGYYYAEKQSEITDTLKGLGEHIASVCNTVERLQNIRIAGKPKIRSVSIVIAREDGPDEELVLMVS